MGIKTKQNLTTTNENSTNSENFLAEMQQVENEYVSKEFKENLSCINKIDWNVYDKNLSFSFRKTINKTIYNNLSKQKTKSHSLVDDNEMEM